MPGNLSDLGKILAPIRQCLSWPKSRSRLERRTAVATAMILDASIGLLYGFSLLNGIDRLVSGALPGDMVWLLQAIQMISGGFFLVKILFDDVSEGWPRTIAIAISPLFLLIFTLLTIEFVLQGREVSALITLDSSSIGTTTLTWAATYLSIAVGLTLTYRVQRYGNFAQSEHFMLGMYTSMLMVWSDYFFPLSHSPRDGTLIWTILISTLIAAFLFSGITGVVVDRLVYSGFRKKNTTPQVMMIASLGVALILRAITYLRFGSDSKIFSPGADWRRPDLRWNIPTTKLRLNLGVRELAEKPSGEFNEETGEPIMEPGVYSSPTCGQSTDPETGELMFNEATMEPVMERVQLEGSKPLYEMYDTAFDCVTAETTGYPFYKAALPALVFSSVILLVLLLNKTRLGRRMRAVADNPDLAASSGINVERIQLTSAFLSAGISGAGGAIFAMTFRFSPETAFGLLLPSFAVIVLGTIGSLPGVIFGSLIVGFVRALSSPILIGIGSPLERSNYSALDEVMPYIFLVAILMIMPKGIGDAYETWKVNRLRRLAEENQDPSAVRLGLGASLATLGALWLLSVNYDNAPDLFSPISALILAAAFAMGAKFADNTQIGAVLSFSPLGAIGAHNFWQRKPSRGESMTIITTGAYALNRFSRFVSKNSFAEDACAKDCSDNETISSNIQFITDDPDGKLALSDSPFSLSDVRPPAEIDQAQREEWKQNALSELNQSWLRLMETEISIVESIISLGDMIWPAVPLLVWALSAVEGYYLLKGQSDSPLYSASTSLKRYTGAASGAVGELSQSTYQMWSKVNRNLDGLNYSADSRIYKARNFFKSRLNQNQKRTILGLAIISVATILPAFLIKAAVYIGIFWWFTLLYLSSQNSGGAVSELRRLAPYGRESPFGSWMAFSSMLILLFVFVVWLPVSAEENYTLIKTMQFSNVMLAVTIFALMALSLNLHTGMTGMVNFGVIFFVGIGAITVGILCAPKDLHGYEWSVFPALLLALAIAAVFGWLLAYPTARLKTDYFAIVTISLGEIVRVLLGGEPLLRAGSHGTSIGISRYSMPFEEWWFCGSEKKYQITGTDETGSPILALMDPYNCSQTPGIGSFAEKLGRGDATSSGSPTTSLYDSSGKEIVTIWDSTTFEPLWYTIEMGAPVPYLLLLSIIGIFSLLSVWWLLEIILSSPWGRILKSIREDEEVAQHHGHDVLTHKAASLALGAAIAALAGAIWAWKMTGFQPNFMMPAGSTFLVWAAFIIGGAGNNRGMIIGAFIIGSMHFVFNVLVVAQGSTDLPLWETAEAIDKAFSWLILNSMEAAKALLALAVLAFFLRKSAMAEGSMYGALFLYMHHVVSSSESIKESFTGSVIETNMAYVKVLLIGLLILYSLKFNPKGLLPEVPSRPDRPATGGDS